jgi:signal transduction histidine kinase
MTPYRKRRTVLLLDDQPDVLTSMGRILERAGYRTVFAATIKEALDRDDWQNYLAAVLDRKLPDGWIDGALPKFRERDPEMALVIVTGFADLDGTISALREQVQDYLLKPVNPELLLARLARIAEHQEARELVRRLEQEVIHTADEEKRRIAMDIHDGMGSKLGGIAMMCQGLERTLRYVGREEEASKAHEIDVLVRETISEARTLSRGLHSVQEDPQGLRDALRNLAEHVRGSWEVDCVLKCPSGFLLHDTIVANHLFRIAQEAVTNAIRHGESTRVEIELEERGNEIFLRVSDNGKGFDPSNIRGRGMGLHSMEYRCRAIGGSLRLQAQRGAGVVVVVRTAKPDGASNGKGDAEADS